LKANCRATHAEASEQKANAAATRAATKANAAALAVALERVRVAHDAAEALRLTGLESDSKLGKAVHDAQHAFAVASLATSAVSIAESKRERAVAASIKTAMALKEVTETLTATTRVLETTQERVLCAETAARRASEDTVRVTALEGRLHETVTALQRELHERKHEVAASRLDAAAFKRDAAVANGKALVAERAAVEAALVTDRAKSALGLAESVAATELATRTNVSQELHSAKKSKVALETALVAAERLTKRTQKNLVDTETKRRDAVASLENLETACEEALRISATLAEELQFIQASEKFLRGEVLAREVRLEQARQATATAREESLACKAAAEAAAATAAARLEKAEAAAYWCVRDLEDALEAERAGRRADMAGNMSSTGG
jgi:hypothetical protein